MLGLPDGMVLARHRAPVSGDGQEERWLDGALEGRAAAALWAAPRGLVAPRSYRRYGTLDRACQAMAAAGWPVRLRQSGGGVVPQGPGVMNLSLALPIEGGPGERADAVYRLLCAVLQRALAALGIACAPRAVLGAFCDGRFNLAVGARKVAGTAQVWRSRRGRHAVLAHALVLVDADLNALTARVNAFEAALASGRVYDPDALVSIERAWREARGGAAPPPDLAGSLGDAIAEALGAL